MGAYSVLNFKSYVFTGIFEIINTITGNIWKNQVMKKEINLKQGPNILILFQGKTMNVSNNKIHLTPCILIYIYISENT